MATKPPCSYRIFISHSAKDDEFGIKLAQDLRCILNDKDAVWYDHADGLRGGDHWWRSITKKLKEAPIFIVILSPDALKSKWVKDEIAMAWQQKNTKRGKTIVPVWYRRCAGDVLEYLGTVQHVSFLPPKIYEESLRDLLKALEPPLEKEISEIRRILENANKVRAREMVMVPEIQDAIDAEDSVMALRLLETYVRAHAIHEQWSYVVHYCEVALQLVPGDSLWSGMRREALSKIEQEIQAREGLRKARSIYDVYSFSNIGPLHLSPRKKPLVDNMSVRRSARASGGRRSKSANTQAAASMKQTSSSKFVKPLPRMHPVGMMTNSIGLFPLLADIIRSFIKFMRYNFSLDEVRKICRTGFSSLMLLVFFVFDIVALSWGLYACVHFWIPAVGTALIFLLGLCSKRNNAFSVLFTAILGAVWCGVGGYYVSLSLPVIIAISFVVSCLRLTLFLKHR